MNYGVNYEIPIERYQPPPKLEDEFHNAVEYLIRQTQKGLPVLHNEDEAKKIYESAVLAVSLPGKRRIRDAKEEQQQERPIYQQISLDPVHQLCLESNIVQRVIEEINDLPFFNQTDAIMYANRYVEDIVRTARSIGYDRAVLDLHCPRKRLKSVTEQFVKYTRERRESILEQIIGSGLIEVAQVKPSIKVEFASLFPSRVVKKREKPMNKADAKASSIRDNVEEKIFQVGNRALKELPCIYRPSVEVVYENKRLEALKRSQASVSSVFEAVEKAIANEPPKHKIEESKTSMSITKPPLILGSEIKTQRKKPPCRRQARTATKETRAQKFSKFWEMTDPLQSKREGGFINTLDELSNLAGDINGVEKNGKEENESKEEETETKDSIIEVKSSTKTIEKKRESIDTKNAILRPEGSRESFKLSADSPLEARSSGHQKKSPLQHQPSSFSFDDTESPVQKKLEDVWEKLGFSTTQKLDMLLKYSNTVEDSARLGDALQAWEGAYGSIVHYNKAYESFKDFLKYRANEKGANWAQKELEVDLQMAEDAVIRMAQILKTNFGDELIMNRRKAVDLIESRRLKNQMRIKEKE